MNALAYAVMLGYLPVACWLFRQGPPARAVVAVTVGGFLFLPVLSLAPPGLPDLDKLRWISVVLACGALCARTEVRAPWRWNWLDVLAIVSVLAWPLAYLSNGFPLYAASSSLLRVGLTWLVPYWLGRRFLANAAGMRTLLLGILLGALVYVPLCLWEVRMSPQLHLQCFGEFQHQFLQMRREGGFRPIVFMRHGLEVALYLASACLAGLALWRAGKRSSLGVPLAWLLLLLAVTLVLAKSLGALLLCLALAPALWWRRGSLWLAVAAAIGLGYIAMRLSLPQQAYALVRELAALAPLERAESMMYRVDMEQKMMQQAWLQPWLGWTIELKGISLDPWTEPEDQSKFVTDSLWILTFLCTGLVGLLTQYGLLAGAIVRGWRSVQWLSAASPERLGVAAIVTLQLLDSLPNGMVAPTTLLGLGALAGCALSPPPAAPVASHQAALRPR